MAILLMSVEWGERSFDLVTEITKQVLTLTTGLIGLTIVFVKDFATGAPPSAKTLLTLAWLLYLLSALGGILTLMASAGIQRDAASNGASPTIDAKNLRWLGAGQLLFFFAGLITTVVAGMKAL